MANEIQATPLTDEDLDRYGALMRAFKEYFPSKDNPDNDRSLEQDNSIQMVQRCTTTLPILLLLLPLCSSYSIFSISIVYSFPSRDFAHALL